MAISPASARSLYRSMLREGKGFMDYNFRLYSQRRVRLGFDQAAANTAVSPAEHYQVAC